MKIEYAHPADNETHATCWINNRVAATVQRPDVLRIARKMWTVATPDGIVRLETNMRPSRAAVLRIAQAWIAANPL